LPKLLGRLRLALDKLERFKSFPFLFSFSGRNITAVVLQPGPNVIKLFTVVSYEFS
jgi:hypothetical protein